VGAQADCLGTTSLTFTTTPGAVCPILQRYDLTGCTDTTDRAACLASTWDLRDPLPPWWPCKTGGSQPYFAFMAADAPVTNGPDVLFSFQLVSGTHVPAFSDLVVDVTLNEAGDSARFTAGHGLTLVDADNNGVLDAGDTVVISEIAGQDLFNPATRPGIYPVSLGAPPDFPSQAAWFYILAPPPPQPALFTLENGAPLTSGLDDLFTLHYARGSETYLVSELSVDVKWGCQVPITFSSSANLVLLDGDGDGRFGPGDGLVVKESSQASWPQQGPLFHNCVAVQGHRGFNWFFDVGQATWVGAPLTVHDAPQALTSGADALFSLTVPTGETFAASDLSVWIGLHNAPAVKFTIGDGVTLVDANGDGRFGAGDRLDVAEVAAVPELSSEGTPFDVTLAVATPMLQGYGVWTSAIWTSGQ
jgi:hypothetical protein